MIKPKDKENFDWYVISEFSGDVEVFILPWN
jgi:hypothetical protein